MWSVRSWPPRRIGYLISEVHELSCLDSLLPSPYSQDERTDMAILSIVVPPVLPASATSAACCNAHKLLNIPAAATACAGCSSDFGKGKTTPTPARGPGVVLWYEEGASELKRETQLKGVIHGGRAGGVLLPLPLQGDCPRFIHLSRPGVGRQRPPQAGAAAIRGQRQAQ